MAQSRICSIPDCGKKHKGHGLCVMHLARKKKYGDPLKARRYPPRGEPWKYLLDHMWNDCPKWPYARGKGGYGHVQHDGVVKDIHRVVCEMVHGPAPTPDADAAHNCGKGGEGCFGARCIEWKTKSENQADRLAHGTARLGEDAYQCKLTDEQVADIRENPKGLLQRELAALHGVSRSYVSQLQGRQRRARS